MRFPAREVALLALCWPLLAQNASQIRGRDVVTPLVCSGGQALVWDVTTSPSHPRFKCGTVTTTPPGADKQVIFNDGGAFGAANVWYNKATGRLVVAASYFAPSYPLDVDGGIRAIEYRGVGYSVDQTCSAGDYILFPNTTSHKWRKCENGATSNFGTAYTAGWGLQLSGDTFAADPAVLPTYATGSSAPPGSCTTGYSQYVYTTYSQWYICIATNTWAFGSWTAATTAPATCTVGQLFFDTDATAGQNIYGCTATDTWTLQGGSSTGTRIDWQKEAAAIPGDSTDKTIYTTSIPANTLSTNKCVRVTAGWYHNSGVATPTYKIFYGSTSQTINSGLSNPGPWTFGMLLCGSGATNAQQWSVFPFTWIQGYGIAGGFNSATTYTATSAEDSTGALNVKLTFNVAATDQVTPLYWMVEKVQ